jgi:DNA mismatch repair protein MutL
MSTAPLLKQSQIKLLDAHTVNQIAAGEVVERPASVVKELVENAIDSCGTRIAVQLQDSGRELISVSDDGCGMSHEDSLSSLQRHATSKIGSLEDLLGALTLGFRGEALPSIASVSRMTLCSSTEPGSRTKLVIEGGEVISIGNEPGPRGTTVTVEDLFFNTPARLKFLKSQSTELGQCLEIIQKYAIAYPGIAFTAFHNGQEVLSTTGSGQLDEALSGVWSRDVVRSLVSVETEIAGISVRGFVAPPHFTKPTRAMQLIYVNGRPVKNRTLMAALDQAYRSLTPERRFPVAVLLLEIDPSRIDINVSPTKTEVKFAQDGAAFDALRYAVKQALLDSGMIPSAEAIAVVNAALADSGSLGFGPIGERGELSFLAQAPINVFPTETGAPDLAAPPISNGSSTVGSLDTVRYPFATLLDGLKVLGQILNTFIIAENRGGLVIIDQHVAHERVLYEYLCGLKGPTAIEIQRLLVPETLHLDRRSALLLTDRLDSIREVGFEIEPFGGESFVVRAAPAALRGKSALKVLQDLADELVESTVNKKLTPTRESIWIMASCKMAIKAGDTLSIPEMEKLILDLAETENPYLCPHGRPITITLGVNDLLRKFGRI